MILFLLISENAHEFWYFVLLLKTWTYSTESNTQEPRDQTLTCKSQDGILFACVVHLICIFGSFVPRGREGFTSST